MILVDAVVEDEARRLEPKDPPVRVGVDADVGIPVVEKLDPPVLHLFRPATLAEKADPSGTKEDDVDKSNDIITRETAATLEEQVEEDAMMS